MTPTRSRHLRTRFFPSPQIDQGLLRQLWRLRLDYFRLGPDVTEEEDWAEFSAYFRRDRRDVIVFFDRRGTPVGFYVNSYDVFELGDRKAVVIWIEYTYMRPAYRGHVAFILAGFRLFLRLLWRFPFTRLYYGGRSRDAGSSGGECRC